MSNVIAPLSPESISLVSNVVSMIASVSAAVAAIASARAARRSNLIAKQVADRAELDRRERLVRDLNLTVVRTVNNALAAKRAAMNIIASNERKGVDTSKVGTGSRAEWRQLQDIGRIAAEGAKLTDPKNPLRNVSEPELDELVVQWQAHEYSTLRKLNDWRDDETRIRANPHSEPYVFVPPRPSAQDLDSKDSSE